MMIQDAADYIYDEIGDAEKYIRNAIKLHETDEEFADCLYKLSGEELGHADRLHEQVTRLIRTYKDEKEREILLEETKKLLKSLTYEQLRSVYIFTLQKIK